MLEAMVEELAASMPAAPPPETAAPDARPPAPEPTPATDAAAADDPVMPEVDLLSNFARVAETPYLPAEVGTAVIFEPRARPEAVAPGEPPAETGAEADDSELDALLFEPLPEAEADPAAFLLEPSPSPAQVPPAPSPEPMRVASEIWAAQAPEPSVAEPPPPVAEPPAEPQTAWSIDLPPLAVTRQADEPQSPWRDEPPSPANVDLSPPAAAAAQARTALPAGAAPDPFAPLKSMSDEEKIALFE
jgi:hypothetical protein